MDKMMDEEEEEEEDLAPRLVTSGQAMELAGHAHRYQLYLCLLMALQYYLMGTVMLGLPLLLRVPRMQCDSLGVMAKALCESVGDKGEHLLHLFCQQPGALSLARVAIESTGHHSLLVDLGLVCNHFMREYLWYGLAAAGAVGSLGGAAWVERTGRMTVMKQAGLLLALGYALAGLSGGHLYIWMAGVLLASAAGGAYLVSSLTYLGEVVSENLRTLLPGLMPAMMLAGQVQVYMLVSQGYFGYTLVFLGGAVGSLVTALLSHKVLVESPRWLVSKQRFEQAKEALFEITETNQRFTPCFELQAQVQLEQVNANIGLIMKIAEPIQSQAHKHSLCQIFCFRSVASKFWMLLAMMCVLGSPLREVRGVLVQFYEDPLISQVVVDCQTLIALLLAVLSLLSCRRRHIIKLMLLLNGAVLVSGLLIISKDIDPWRVSAIRSYSLVMLQTANLALVAHLAVLLVYTLELVPSALRHFAYAWLFSAFLLGWALQPLLLALMGGKHKYSLFLEGLFHWALLCSLGQVRETANQAMADQVDEEKNQITGSKHFNDY